MNFLLNLLPFVSGLFSRAKDSSDIIEKHANAENLALRAQLAAESSRAPVTKWDSFVDGVNRLVRPLCTFGSIGMIVWACVDPISFSAAMTALQLVPPDLWVIIGVIIASWFGDRMLNLSGKTKSAAQVAEVISQVRSIQALQSPQDAPGMTPAQQADLTRREAERPSSGAPIASEDYERELADLSKPMSLPAIEEWNRRRRQKSLKTK